MASVSSTSSTSSSLGNTALRGYGGLSSGLDRDALIEQMTASTTAKITSKKQALTKLQWKQEAYRSISDKILDLQDTYLSYSGTQSLKNSDFFARNKITATGDSDYTKYITATGQSDAASRVNVLAVKQMATSATTISGTKRKSGDIVTSLNKDTFASDTIDSSKLSQTKLSFGTYDSVNQKFNVGATFTFPTSYQETKADGTTETVEIDYTADAGTVVEQLNKALNEEHFLSKDGKGDAGIQFELSNGKIQIRQTDNISDEGKSYAISDISSALSAMGFESGNSGLSGDELNQGITIDKFNATTAKGKDFSEASVYKQPVTDYLKGKTISITYGSQTKQVDLLREGDTVTSYDEFKDLLQKRINQAFGSGKITLSEDNGAMAFQSDERITVSADTPEIRQALGIKENQSNMITTGQSLWENREYLGFSTSEYTDDEVGKAKFNEALANFSINGEKISGITADTTVTELMSAINKNKYAGVTATYVSNENKFVLTSNEKGRGRTIDLGDENSAANTIFGITAVDGSEEGKGSKTDGQDAEMLVNYNGVETTLKSTTNTFEVDGLKLTVSHTFDTADANGKYTVDSGVSFNATADIDTVTERVKKFIEDYNALIDETRSQATTRPDSDYSPLTDDQKSEMDETSIKNWEDKAKEGILFNSSVLKDLNISVQTIFTTMMQNGISYDDLESVGVSFSDDYSEGGKIVFDEDKFRSAMETDPDLVSDLFTGDHGVVQTINDTLKTYATRYAYQNGGSYGSLIEEAGSDKLSLSLTNNSIYKEIQDMQEVIKNLQSQLSTEQDRYISQFTTMETLISQMNSQSSYLSQLAG